MGLQVAKYKDLNEDRPKPTPHLKWELLRVISGHIGTYLERYLVGWVRSLAVDVSNEWFASGSGDRTIKVFWKGNSPH